MAVAILDTCPKHGESELFFDVIRAKFACLRCRIMRNKRLIVAAEAKHKAFLEAERTAEQEEERASQARRFFPRIQPPLLDKMECSTDEALNISPLWPNGEPRKAGFCKRRTCLFVKMTFDRDRGFLFCHQCDYFELPGEVCAKEMRVIYAENQDLPFEWVAVKCPRCEFTLKLEERLQLITCVGCDYSLVAEAEHLKITLERIKEHVGNTREEIAAPVGESPIAL